MLRDNDVTATVIFEALAYVITFSAFLVGLGRWVA